MKRSPLPRSPAPKQRRAVRGVGKRNKYGVATDGLSRLARTRNGVEYHSALEARYAAQLDLRLKEIGPRRLRAWRGQVPVKLEVAGKLVTTYIVDFVLEHADGHVEWVEVKGFQTPEWRIKEKLFRALYPERKLTVLTARDIRS